MNENIEQWKYIANTNKMYRVSNLGRVFSCKSNKCIGSLGSGRANTLYMTAAINGKPKLIHRLVAEAFIKNPNSLPEVDHIDGNTTNNAYTNLRWVTHKQNQEFASLDGSMNLPHYNNRSLTDNEIKELIKMRDNNIKYKIIAEKFNIKENTAVCYYTKFKRGKIFKHIK